MKSRSFATNAIEPSLPKIEEVGILTVTHKVDGIPYRFTFRPGDYKCKILAHQLGTEWKERNERAEPTRFGPQVGRQAMRSFCTFIDSNFPEAASSISLSGNAVQFLEILYRWESQLVQQMPARSSEPKRAPGRVLDLIRQRHERGREVAPLILRRTKAGASFGTRRGEQQLPEYSQKELKALTESARSDIRQIKIRLQKFSALADSGRSPNEAGWTLENLMWKCRQTGIDGSDLEEAFGDIENLPSPIKRLAQELHIVLDQRSSRKWLNAANAIQRALVPSERELIPFMVLLLYKTGLTHAEMISVSVESFKRLDSTIEMTVTKTRANKTRVVSFDDSIRGGDDPWSINALLMDIYRITEFARHEAAEEFSHLLWLCHYVSNGVRTVKRVTHRKHRLSHWIDEHQIEATSPANWNRLRKSHKTVRALTTGNVEVSAGTDHSSQVFIGHYASTATVLRQSGKSIIKSASAAFTDAVNGPRVLASSSKAAAADWPLVPEAASAVVTAASLTSADRSTTVGTCMDMKNPPDSSANFCTSQVRLCLVCPNALILEDNLPQVLILQNHLENLRKVTSPPEFYQAYGQVCANISMIIAEFDKDVIDVANEKVEMQLESLSIPISMKVELNP